MKDAHDTEPSLAWWEKITGLALTVEKSGESIILRGDPASLMKYLHLLPPMFRSAIENYLKEFAKS